MELSTNLRKAVFIGLGLIYSAYFIRNLYSLDQIGIPAAILPWLVLYYFSKKFFKTALKSVVLGTVVLVLMYIIFWPLALLFWVDWGLSPLQISIITLIIIVLLASREKEND